MRKLTSGSGPRRTIRYVHAVVGRRLGVGVHIDVRQRAERGEHARARGRRMIERLAVCVLGLGGEGRSQFGQFGARVFRKQENKISKREWTRRREEAAAYFCSIC